MNGTVRINQRGGWYTDVPVGRCGSSYTTKQGFFLRPANCNSKLLRLSLVLVDQYVTLYCRYGTYEAAKSNWSLPSKKKKKKKVTPGGSVGRQRTYRYACYYK